MKKIIGIVVFFIAVIVFLLGFVNLNYTQPVKSTADITYSINNLPKNMKVAGGLTKREQDIICATSKGLIQVDADGKIIPSLAESVDIKDDGIQYNFKIRDDVYWSDGTKITPKDIVMFFREVITVENESDIETFLNIFGAKDFRDSNVSFNENVGISYDDTTVTIRLNSADDNFLYELAKPQYRVRKNVLLWENITSNYLSIPYSGEYMISDVESTQFVLTRSPKADVKLAQTIHVVKDESEDLALAAFEIGNRDIVVNPPKSQLERLNSEGKLVSLHSNKAMYLVFNPNNDSIPVSGKREIYKDISKAIESYQLSNKSSMELADGSYFRTDEEDLSKLQARKVMSNSEEDTWEKPKEIEIIAEENLQNKDLVDFLAKWFDDNTDMVLNATLIKEDEMNTLKDKTFYDIALVDVVASYNEQDKLYNSISPYMTQNLQDRISVIKDDEEKVQEYADIEDTLYNTYSILPLVFYNENIAINKSISNIALDANGNLVFEMNKK